MAKFKARYIVAIILAAAIISGSTAIYSYKNQNKSTANVVKVSEANDGSFLGYSSNEYYGTLKKGSVQNVMYDPTLTISEVLVKKGDHVKKGDALFNYDQNSLMLSLDEAQNRIKTTDNEIKIATNELNVLKKLQPSENAPVPDDTAEPDDEHGKPTDTPDTPDTKFTYDKRITLKSKPFGGKGSEEEPLEIYAGVDTIVTKEVLLSYCTKDGSAKYAVFYVCDDTGSPLFARMVDGSKIDADTAKDWSVADGVTPDESGGFSFDGGSAGFASFIIKQADTTDYGSLSYTDMDVLNNMENMGESTEQQTANDENNSGEISEKDNYVYSLEELKSMIKEKENTIDNLNLRKRQAELDVKKAQKALETGSESASFDGVVTFVAKDTKHLSENGAYIAVTSSYGMSIVSTVGEFSLEDIQIGKTMSATDFGSGKSYTGEITSINNRPTSKDSLGNESTTESFYEFTVTFDNDLKLEEGETVGLKLNDESQAPLICLYSIFVRQEGGRYYVMVANEDNILEKRYVTVGQKFYGMSTEVTSGLSLDDRIAFAYGSSQEGMTAVDVSYNTMLYGSLF